MTPEQWERIEATFDEATARPPEQRSAYLDEACGDDPVVRAEVDAMLRSDSNAATFLETPAAGGGFRVGNRPESHLGARGRAVAKDIPMSSCVSENELLAFVDGSASAGDRATWNAHFDVCDVCASRLTEAHARSGIAEATVIAAATGAPGLDAGGALPPSDSIPGYKILKELHRGGQGVVYQAVQRATKRKVALKVMLEGPFAGAASKRRFEREIELVGSLRHPGIVPIFDSGVAQGQFFYAMEYVRGEPLAAYVQARQLSVDDTLRLLAKVCDAVDYAHQKGVIHRDLKPSNILVDERGDPHVLDFGLAKVGGAEADEEQSMLVSVTGQIMGTLAYMSPEQAAGRPDQVDMRSDVYALGVLMYELLTGEMPYDVSGQMAAALTTIQHTAPRRPGTHRRKINDEVDTIVLKAMSKDRTRRYPMAGMLGADIERFLAGEPIEAKRDSVLYVFRKTVRRYRTAAVIALAFSLLASGALVVSLSLWRSAVRQSNLAVTARNDAVAAQEVAVTEKKRADEQAETLRERLYVYHIMRAATALDEYNAQKAREFLDACPENQRRWEWERLSWLAGSEQVTTLPAREQPLFTPDGQHLIAAGMGDDENTLQLFDLTTGKVLRTFRGHTGKVLNNALSRDGKRLASTDADRLLLLWDVESTQVLWRVPDAHTERTDGMAFSPDGASVASASWDGTLTVWDAATGTKRFEVSTGEMLRGAAFSPDGTQIACGSNYGLGLPLRRWDLTTGEQMPALEGKELKAHSAAYSPDGRWLVVAGDDSTIGIWDAATGKFERSLSGHSKMVRSVAFSPDGRRLVSVGWDLTVRLWDFDTGAPLATFRGHTEMIHWVSFSPDGRRVASFSVADGIRLWNVAGGLGALSLHAYGINAKVFAVAHSPDGRQLASGGSVNILRLWDVATGRELRNLRGQWNITALAYTADGALLASASSDETVWLWHPDTGEPSGVLRDHRGAVRAVAFSSDGSRLVTAGDDSVVRVWNVAARQVIHTLTGHEGTVNAVDHSADGKWIVSAGADKTIRLWDARTGEAVRTLAGHTGAVLSVAFSPDGSRIASGGGDDDGTLRLWDTATGNAVLAPIGTRGDRVGAVAFGPKGDRVFTGSADGSVRVWSATTGDQLMTLPGSDEAVNAISLDPNGRTLAVAGGDQTVRLWETGPPPTGAYATRRTVDLARRAVDQHYSEHRFAAPVLDALRRDTRLGPAVRDMAIRIATARGEDLTTFFWLSIWGVHDTGATDDDYHTCLKMARVGLDATPESEWFRFIVGAAQYRLRDYAGALETLTHAKKTFATRSSPPYPPVYAFLAMTHHQLGDDKAARNALAQAQRLARTDTWAKDNGTRTILPQAEGLIPAE